MSREGMRSTWGGGAATLALLLAGGCAVDERGPAPAQVESVGGGAGQAESPKPVATLALASGSQLEFYDFDTGVLVSETGKAGAPVTYQPQAPTDAGDVTAIWRSLAPTTPVPVALTRLQQRFATRRAGSEMKGSGVPDETQGFVIMPETAPAASELVAAPDGCNNGCCDYEWLTTFPQCGGGQWLHYNVGYSWANTGSNAVVYNGFVCSAQGTSVYKVVISGYGGTWSVAEGFYRTYTWSAGYTCNPFCHDNDKSVRSSVNTSTDQHLHTYCGYFVH